MQKYAMLSDWISLPFTLILLMLFFFIILPSKLSSILYYVLKIYKLLLIYKYPFQIIFNYQ